MRRLVLLSIKVYGLAELQGEPVALAIDEDRGS